MIHVIKLDELSFTVRFDEKMTDKLSEVSGWGSLEFALTSILSDALLGWNPPEEYLWPDDDDGPF